MKGPRRGGRRYYAGKAAMDRGLNSHGVKLLIQLIVPSTRPSMIQITYGHGAPVTGILSYQEISSRLSGTLAQEPMVPPDTLTPLIISVCTVYPRPMKLLQTITRGTPLVLPTQPLMPSSPSSTSLQPERRARPALVLCASWKQRAALTTSASLPPPWPPCSCPPSL